MKRIERILAICILLLTCFSCQKNEELLHAGVATIQFNLTESEFELPQQALGKYGQKQAMIENKVVPVGEWFMEVSIKAKDGLQKTASDNVVKNSIPKGVYYRILVFDSNNRFLESKDYVVGAGQQDYLQLSTSEKYSFIVYSLGKNEPLPAINLVKGDLKDAAFLQLESVEDVMVAQQENVQLHVGDNNLNLVLRHVFSQVAVEINSSEVGSIQGIEALELSNTYRSAKVLLGAEKTPLTFAGNLISSKISNITIGTDKYSAYGVPTLFYADGAEINNLSAKGITIDGIKRDVDLLTMRALPGISYTVTIQFKKKQNSLEGFEDGNVIWASGNLIRDANGNYAFASSQGEYGDYWYRDEQGHVYTQPFGEVNKTSAVGGKVENICGLVGKGWRLPTYKDISYLEKFGAYYTSSVNYYYGTYYLKDKSKVIGTYFGTNKQPAVEDQDKYLFLPAAGSYNSGNPLEIGQACYYWHSGVGINGEGTSFQIGQSYISANNNGGLDKNRVNTIRCVKDK